eukprot:CAMPEP_0171931742 /NCGR_PEP_ID=MMETSP0993-20121228/29716_1 /TAXON_ID=483369 /ORGANISM="non described non described, Strain CCMP2098" /LENGTH=82 /DNA_ID=CAMNT_0012571849 /DNA_START=48 /DNA_END=293 /DNA_ORIENTATION=-
MAQFNLGNMYRTGEGVAQDFNEAVRWYGKAADQGDVRSMSLLGLLYIKGLGVVRDPQKAAHLFRKAADQGNAIAQYNLGVMY